MFNVQGCNYKSENTWTQTELTLFKYAVKDD